MKRVIYLNMRLNNNYKIIHYIIILIIIIIFGNGDKSCNATIQSSHEFMDSFYSDEQLTPSISHHRHHNTLISLKNSIKNLHEQSTNPKRSVQQINQQHQLSKPTTKKVITDSSNLKLEYCNECDLYLGGLFPVHAPKYMRQMTLTNLVKKNGNGGPVVASKDLNNYTILKSRVVSATGNNNNNNNISNLPKINLDNIQSIAIESSSDIDEYYLNGISCGEIKKERGIQRLEAMLYAIDLINNSTTLLPNIKLGARIFDTCDRDTIALEKCINFVGDYYVLNNENIANDFSCERVPANSIYENKYGANTNNNNNNNINSIPRKRQDSIYKRKVVGVIGAASSSVSIQVANLLRLFQVPQISYASTSPELSNKEKFPFFSRVLPSDKLQAEAMASLVYHLDWNYVATLGEEGNLGGIDAFISYAKAKKICISGSYTISQTASEEYVKSILNDMYKSKTARGVVMFLQDHNIRKLLEIVHSLNMTGHFLWIASDSWGTKKESIGTNNLVAEGAITFLPKSYEIKEFNEYFKKLKPKTNKRNVWFNEFWEEQFNCTMDHAVSYSNQPKLSKRLCTGEENLNFTQDGFIHFVIDSVFSMAYAIQNLLNTHCSNYTTHTSQYFDCQHKIALKGPELLKAIRNVEFVSITGRAVRFIKDKENIGDGLAPFEVFQYQQYEPGKFGYQKLTEWEKDKPFIMDKSKLKWNLDQNNDKLPKSVCKEECGVGEIKQGDDCCWVCVRCEENEYVSPNRKECIKCAMGYGPDQNKTNCVKLDIEYMTFNSAFTIIPIIFSSIGIIFTCYVIFVFIRYNNTPIIKASGRELCYVLLAGIMSCFLITFPLVTKPTTFSCIILRFGVSLSLTVCLSALFTKTNRLSRIFNNSIKQVRQASYVSPTSQLVICFTIIGIQVLGILIWIVLSPPNIDYDYEDPKRVILQCKTQNHHFAVSQVYNMFLVALCTIYAIKTRKIPENFNEARFIGFTMYSICIIWAAFIPIYFGTTAAAGSSKSPKNNYKIQLTTMAMCLSLSATVILFCLFLPKLNVVLLKPNKNVRVKSSNIVKSVYKTQQQQQNNQQQSQALISTKETTATTILASTCQATNVEKSITLGTGASCLSTPSSPGLPNSNLIKKTVFSTTSGNLTNSNNSAGTNIMHQSNITQSNTLAEPAKTNTFLSVKKENFLIEKVTTASVNNKKDENNNILIKETKDSLNNPTEIKCNDEPEIIKEEDIYKEIDENILKSLENNEETDIVSIDNSDEQLTIKLLEENLKNESNKEFKAIRIGFSRSPSSDSTNKTSSPIEYYYLVKPNYVKKKIINKIIDENMNIIDENCLIRDETKELMIKQSKETNSTHTIKKLDSPSTGSSSSGEYTSTSTNPSLSYTSNNFSNKINIDTSIVSSSINNNILTNTKNINLNDLNEKAMKKVLEKCFDQLTKTNKLSSPCIYVKQKPSSPFKTNSFKLIDINPIKPDHLSSTLSRIDTNDSSSFLKVNRIINHQNINLINDINNDDLSSISSMSSIDNAKIKQTVVEKAVDILNAPTNTVLVSGTNDINELYSLKITFV